MRTRTRRAVSQIQRRLDGGCELFVDAKWFVFQAPAGKLYVVIYHSQAYDRTGNPARLIPDWMPAGTPRLHLPLRRDVVIHCRLPRAPSDASSGLVAVS